MELSGEQLAVLQSNKQHLIVNAGPGTGKTTLLLNIAKHRTNEKHLILCFNSAIKEEIKEKLNKQNILNADVYTFHSLAFNFFLNNNIIPNFKKRNFNENLDFFTLFDIMSKLNIIESYMDFRLRDTLIALHTYLKSDKKLEDFNLNEETYKNTKNVIQYILSNSESPMFHEVYIKLFQLMKPIVSYDSILIDEFQDVSACYLSIIENISKNKRSIKVGDTYQKIYGYNGALGMEECDFKLTKSFRIGKEVSNYCNNLLETFFENPIKLNGVNENQHIVSEIDNEKQYTKIFRSNKNLMLEALNLIKENKVVKLSNSIISDFEIYEKLLDLTKNYRNYRGIKIGSFKELKQLEKLSKDRKISKFLFLLKNFEIDELKNIFKKIKINLIPEDSEKSYNVHLITAHRCKGLEFDSVVLANDFYTINELLEKQEKEENIFDEIYILFVALTRSFGLLEI